MAAVWIVCLTVLASVAGSSGQNCRNAATSEGRVILRHGQSACAPLQRGENEAAHKGRRFVTCVYGNVLTQSCPLGLRFEMNTRICTWSWAVNCKIPWIRVTDKPTTISPTSAVRRNTTTLPTTTIPTTTTTATTTVTERNPSTIRTTNIPESITMKYTTNNPSETTTDYTNDVAEFTTNSEMPYATSDVPYTTSDVSKITNITEKITAEFTTKSPADIVENTSNTAENTTIITTVRTVDYTTNTPTNTNNDYTTSVPTTKIVENVANIGDNSTIGPITHTTNIPEKTNVEYPKIIQTNTTTEDTPNNTANASLDNKISSSANTTQPSAYYTENVPEVTTTQRTDDNSMYSTALYGSDSSTITSFPETRFRPEANNVTDSIIQYTTNATEDPAMKNTTNITQFTTELPVNVAAAEEKRNFTLSTIQESANVTQTSLNDIENVTNADAGNSSVTYTVDGVNGTWTASPNPPTTTSPLAVANVTSNAALSERGLNLTTTEGLDLNQYSTTATTSIQELSDKTEATTAMYPDVVEFCNSDNCQLPDCFCYGATPNITKEDTPMFVMLTIDGAVTTELYNKVFKDLLVANTNKFFNPSGCPIRATLFLSDQGTDYESVNRLSAAGHEVASYTVTESLPLGFSDADYNDTKSEIDGLRSQVLQGTQNSKLYNSIVGFRAPRLRAARDVQFEVLRDENFLYDSSLATIEIYSHRSPVWPFTLDFQIEQCPNPPCPTKSYGGLWEVPINSWLDANGNSCNYIDSCSLGTDIFTADDRPWYNLFKTNFEKYFLPARVPMQVAARVSTFSKYRSSYTALVTWLRNTLSTYKNVWFVTPKMLIEWMQNPITHSQMVDQKWGC